MNTKAFRRFVALMALLVLAPRPAVVAKAPGEAALAEFHEFQRWFHKQYLAFNPDEACYLGMREQCVGLKDLSLQEAEAAFHRDVLVRSEPLVAGALPAQERIDLTVIRSLATHLSFLYGERQDHLRNPYWATYPYLTIQNLALRARGRDDWRVILGLVRGIPRFLAAHEDNLLRGRRLGLEIPRVQLEHVQQSLPAVKQSFFEAMQKFGSDLGTEQAAFEAACTVAGGAYHAHEAFLRRDIAPAATDAFALGEETYLRTLHAFGLVDSLSDITRAAEADLEAYHGEMRRLASRIERRPVESAGGIAAVLARLRERHPQTTDEVIPAYKKRSEQLIRFLREKELFDIPVSIKMLIEPTPDGYSVSAATNGPAPLMDPQGSGTFLVELKHGPAAHTLVDMGWICAHEGVPGHYLQSLYWQRLASGGAFGVPTRFFGVADDGAWVRSAWAGTMPMVEGFALWIERLLVRSDAYSDEERLAAYSGLALRACRVIVDTRLHTGCMSRDEAEAFLVTNACIDPEGARSEVRRYMVIPTQAPLYSVGMHQIEELFDAWGQHAPSGSTLRQFHSWLMQFGPVLPARIHGLLREGLLRWDSTQDEIRGSNPAAPASLH